MQKTIIVGETDNIGTFNTVAASERWWGDEEGRSRGTLYFINNPVLVQLIVNQSNNDWKSQLIVIIIRDIQVMMQQEEIIL